ncbi:hypothetical protein [Lentilitoribacter sp. EG35]|uniref:hypothetical protein n=1 Tax=Lentilitoribacter sp. EG35 TaxID=3234192 RepID=UPI0034610880
MRRNRSCSKSGSPAPIAHSSPNRRLRLAKQDVWDSGAFGYVLDQLGFWIFKAIDPVVFDAPENPHGFFTKVERDNHADMNPFLQQP